MTRRIPLFKYTVLLPEKKYNSNNLDSGLQLNVRCAKTQDRYLGILVKGRELFCVK